jgi:hypothetical protein
VGRREKGSGSQGKVGQWVGGSWAVGRRGKWDSGPKGAAQVAGRDAVREGESIPPGWVDLRVRQGKRGRRGERDVRRCRPTLHGRARSRRGGGFERGVGPRCTDGPSLVGEKGGVRCKRGTGGGEGRYPSTLHRRAPSSHQESRERRPSPRRRLRKIGSCSSLNSQKEPIPTQSPPLAARKILRGRARFRRRGARGQRRLANRICGSCGRACASAGPYSGP